MKKIILPLLLIFSLASCKDSNKNNKIKAAQWLLGKWENKSDDGNLQEIWKKANDSTFLGESYFIKEEDTIHFETITLQQNGEELKYNTTIKGQNDDEPVTFILTNELEKELVFENKKHDYPQKISYKLLTPKSLVAKIYGTLQGKPSSEHYTMAKTE